LPGEFHGLRSLAAAKGLKEFSLFFQSVNNLLIAFSTERKENELLSLGNLSHKISLKKYISTV